MCAAWCPWVRPSNALRGKRVLGGGIGVTGPGLAAGPELNGPLDETGETAKTESGDVADPGLPPSPTISETGSRRVFRVSAICAADARPDAQAGREHGPLRRVEGDDRRHGRP